MPLWPLLRLASKSLWNDTPNTVPQDFHISIYSNSNTVPQDFHISIYSNSNTVSQDFHISIYSNSNTVSQDFPISIDSNSNTVSQDVLICIYKNLHKTLILLTEITMLKPLVFKKLENNSMAVVLLLLIRCWLLLPLWKSKLLYVLLYVT